MSRTVTIQEAQARLAEIVAHMSGGEEIVITKDHNPVARLVREPPTSRHPRRPGNCKGLITLLTEDKEHLEGFAEYMQ
ncbi:MAG: type II toxin-antitoxin system Phd/YefM family antitoxin [Planctomycetes bacterium]|nr:type II toxin-antitoxin system Phd/YefM family antitoxin [Planctomycetota bacterium]